MNDYPINLDTFLPHQITVLASKISESLAVEYKNDFHTSIPEWRVMAVLSQYPHLSAKELTTLTSLEKVKLCRTTKKMCEDDLILRKRSSEDKRKVFFRLSKKGRYQYKKIAPLAMNWQSNLLSLHSDEEIKLFTKMINELTDKLAT